MMDVITGKTRPDNGDVFFGQGAYDLSKLDETQIAELGIGRKFQKPTVFDMHTVEDNLLLALKNDRSVRATLLWRESSAQQDRIDQDSRHYPARNAPARASPAACRTARSNGSRSACCWRRSRRLLLVDEPVAGMTDAETMQTAELLKEINRDKTVIVVEHDMDFVRELGVKVTCLHEGRCLRKAPSTRSRPTTGSSKSIWGAEVRYAQNLFLSFRGPSTGPRSGPADEPARQPGIHNPSCGVSIPGSPLRGAPE